MTANLQAPNKHGCRSAAKIPTPKPNWTHDGEIIQKHTQMVRRLTLLLQSRTKFDICNAWAKTTWEILDKGDINTSAMFLDPPAELIGRINVVPELNDVMALTIKYVGGRKRQ